MILVSDIHISVITSGGLDALWQALHSDPDKLLVIAGDLTQIASTREYQRMETFLLGIIDKGCSLILTPGNHDFGGCFFEYVLCCASVAAKRRYRRLHMRLLDALERSPSPSPSPLPFSVLYQREFDTVARAGPHLFVTLRTHHPCFCMPGLATEHQADWARECLADLERRGALKDTPHRHLVTHHSLWKGPGDPHMRIRYFGRLIAGVLEPFAFTSCINGHNHRFAVKARPVGTAGRTVLHVQLPTLSNRLHRHSGPPGFVAWVLGDMPRLVDPSPSSPGVGTELKVTAESSTSL
eukprot:gnl/Trimastix_PCT/4200.p1 GENE.gnl/Trimastix_PCT/4200~~gnl/Trimastix_PCT/4200.p1  ORF type:complete len:296 (+),score=47.31 gnl/Trimastix_PCT/4200:95-982(+)